MTRPTNPNGRSRNIDINLNQVDLSTSNNKPTSPSKNKTNSPTIRNIAENNETVKLNLIILNSIVWNTRLP